MTANIEMKSYKSEAPLRGKEFKADFEMLRLTPDFETLHLACDSKTLRQMPVRRPPDATLRLTLARCQPDVTFRNQASGARFQNLASDVIFCDHVSEVQYESGYVEINFMLKT